MYISRVTSKGVFVAGHKVDITEVIILDCHFFFFFAKLTYILRIRSGILHRLLLVFFFFFFFCFFFCFFFFLFFFFFIYLFIYLFIYFVDSQIGLLESLRKAEPKHSYDYLWI